jgi:hypothetical protein
MNDYGIMNEEKAPHEDNSAMEQQDIISDTFKDPSHIRLFLKVTDSDIRSVDLNPEEETVASLKAKVAQN